MFPLPQLLPALSALPKAAAANNVDTGLMCALQGLKKRQCHGSVGSVDHSEAIKDSRNVITSFKFPQESPPRKSTLPSPTQQQGHLDAAAHPFMLPGLGGINLGMTKEPALHVESPCQQSNTGQRG